MLVTFMIRIRWSEYRLYAKIKRKFGADCFVLGGVFFGTGDYYCVGLYLEQWLEHQGIKNYVYIAKQGAEENVAKLFPVFQGHIYSLPNRFIQPSCVMNALCGGDEVDLRFFHLPTFPNSICGGKKNVLQGYRGLDMLDYYLHAGFCMPRNTKPRLPEFSRDEDVLLKLFTQYGAVPGRTVLLAPHTTGNIAYSLPEKFWEQLAEGLKEIGYHILTNCAGNEQPIRGTTAAYIPYAQIVPFLEMAGGFIGIRSGLCEIISSAACKKVVLHTYHSEWWHDGHSIPYTGLVHMGLCDDANEFIYYDKEKAAIATTIKEIFE
ncbi:hypothetical protein HMPREF0322_05150 [Desulfitobacterium hafniense DP7]|uniref:Polysaccharide pyruvyl transferase domain-containing protein n=2 Tax=Desulfitobacterium hafniense TaxID=49338 RepID=G9XVW7_DESHA|nr:hypothetical protein HMPREF0322_05150 [Desulfitobacterium hafniense DP7]